METPQSKGRQFEEELSEEFNLRLVPASGATWHSKLDLLGKETRWSLKYSESGSFPIKAVDIATAEEQCFGVGGDGRTPIWAARMPRGDYVVLRKEDFVAMQEGNVNLINKDTSKAAERKSRANLPELLRDDGN